MITWAAAIVLEMGKFFESVIRTSPPVVLLGSWSNILWVNWYFDFFTCFPVGCSSSIDPGTLPWKIYFSDLGTWANTSGARWKFFAITDLGVWATYVVNVSQEQ